MNENTTITLKMSFLVIRRTLYFPRLAAVAIIVAITIVRKCCYNIRANVHYSRNTFLGIACIIIANSGIRCHRLITRISTLSCYLVFQTFFMIVPIDMGIITSDVLAIVPHMSSETITICVTTITDWCRVWTHANLSIFIYLTLA